MRAYIKQIGEGSRSMLMHTTLYLLAPLMRMGRLVLWTSLIDHPGRGMDFDTFPANQLEAELFSKPCRSQHLSQPATCSEFRASVVQFKYRKHFSRKKKSTESIAAPLAIYKVLLQECLPLLIRKFKGRPRNSHYIAS